MIFGLPYRSIHVIRTSSSLVKVSAHESPQSHSMAGLENLLKHVRHGYKFI